MATLLGGIVLLAPVGVAPPASARSADYFVEAFGDPLDFSNQEDAILNTNDAMMFGTTNRSMSDGQLHFDTAGIFRFDALWPGYPTGIPHGREGGRVPIDAARFRRVILRMNAPEGAPLGLRWFSCLEQNSACTGGQVFVTHDGWQTYDLALGQGGDGSLPVAWSGQILGLSLVGNVAGHFDIDYVRLVPADATDIGEITGAAPAGVLPVDRLDYATAAGNPWDMDTSSDVTVANLAPGWAVANNRLSGCTMGTAAGQHPQVFFTLPRGITIDANRFKTLTFEYTYQGTFDTRPIAGGGAFARVFWYDANGARHPTMAIHLYPNHNLAQVRLDDPRAVFQGVESGKGKSGAPWAGAVKKFSINPLDDKAPRCFTIGRVMLTADEPAGATLSAPSAKAAPVGSTPVAGAAVRPGTTTPAKPLPRAKSKAKRPLRK